MTAHLAARGIGKAFPGVKALDGVDFDLASGEVHALVGENGAGKSTLMKILAGTYTRDAGVISVDEQEVMLGSKNAAEAAGISIVFQESSLLQNLTVAENLFCGQPPQTPRGLVDWKQMNAICRSLFKKLNIDVAPETITGSLSLATQKMIEITRALSRDFRILILDEPTAAIAAEETEQLFRVIRKLRDDGKSIIYISHRLQELKEIADRVTILKDGRLVGTYPMADIDEREICERMVGRELLGFAYESHIKDRVVLEVRQLCGKNFSNVSFTLKEGEFLTLTGLTGAGRTELALTLFGDLRPDGGEILIEEKQTRIRSPWAAMKAGIGYVTEDRKTLGLFMGMSISENMESNNIDSLTPGLLSLHKSITAMASKNVKDFNIHCSGIEQDVETLSGGNQQKVCLSRWISYQPKILIVDEPTLGVDVGSKEEIYSILNQLTRDGLSVIMISSDMIETLSMGDRILVMCEGRLMATLDREKTSEEEVVALASGIELTDMAS